MTDASADEAAERDRLFARLLAAERPGETFTAEPLASESSWRVRRSFDGQNVMVRVSREQAEAFVAFAERARWQGEVDETRRRLVESKHRNGLLRRERDDARAFVGLEVARARREMIDAACLALTKAGEHMSPSRAVAIVRAAAARTPGEGAS